MQKVIYTILKNKIDSDVTTPPIDETLSSDRVIKINLKVKVKNLTGTFNVTDLMLQTGDKTSIWNSHPSEVRWTFNE